MTRKLPRKTPGATKYGGAITGAERAENYRRFMSLRNRYFELLSSDSSPVHRGMHFEHEGRSYFLQKEHCFVTSDSKFFLIISDQNLKPRSSVLKTIRFCRHFEGQAHEIGKESYLIHLEKAIAILNEILSK